MENREKRVEIGSFQEWCHIRENQASFEQADAGENNASMIFIVIFVIKNADEIIFLIRLSIKLDDRSTCDD